MVGATLGGQHVSGRGGVSVLLEVGAIACPQARGSGVAREKGAWTEALAIHCSQSLQGSSVEAHSNVGVFLLRLVVLASHVVPEDQLVRVRANKIDLLAAFATVLPTGAVLLALAATVLLMRAALLVAAGWRVGALAGSRSLDVLGKVQDFVHVLGKVPDPRNLSGGLDTARELITEQGSESLRVLKELITHSPKAIQEVEDEGGLGEETVEERSSKVNRGAELRDPPLSSLLQAAQVGLCKILVVVTTKIRAHCELPGAPLEL